MRKMMGTVGALVLACGAALAQAGNEIRPTFEVSVIRVHDKDGSRGGRLTPSQNTLTVENVSIKMCIAWAYEIREDLLSVPSVLDSQGYDISAKAASATSLSDIKLMFQRLLEERLHLVFHREMKVIPIYAMVVGKSGMKHIAKATPDRQRHMVPSVGPTGEQRWTFHNYPMSMFARYLGNFARDRPVIDMTGVDGVFEFTFSVPAKDPDMTPIDHAWGEVFPAVSAQLGLSLAPRSAPVEVFVVDNLDKVPTEN